jgi:hypothetical protein
MGYVSWKLLRAPLGISGRKGMVLFLNKGDPASLDGKFVSRRMYF